MSFNWLFCARLWDDSGRLGPGELMSTNKISRVRASLVVVHNGRLLTVQLQDPATKEARLYVPGGLIEPGETPAIAAVRETTEETGYLVTVVPGTDRVSHYDFVWNGATYACSTHFMRGTLSDPHARPQPVTDAAYNHGVVWLPISQVPEALGFHTVILEEVLAAMLRSAPSEKG